MKKFAIKGCAVLSAVISIVVIRTATAQSCQPFWINSDPYFPASLGGTMAVFDDGTGPALYTGIYLNGINPRYRARIGRWNGHAWQVLEQGASPLFEVDTLIVLDDGAGARLYAMVGLSDIGWAMLKWTGSDWVATPSELCVAGQKQGETSFPLTSFDFGSGSAIYGLHGYDVARWDGTAWISLGRVGSVGSFDMITANPGGTTALYAVGAFVGIEGVPGTGGIAKWDGAQWSSLGGGITSGGILQSCVFDTGAGPEIYLSNVNEAAGSLATGASQIARWNGQRWATLAVEPTGPVNHMVVFDDGSGPAMFVNGYFPQPGGPTKTFAKYTGHSWEYLPLTVGTGSDGMCVFNEDPRGPSLFVNGVYYVGLGQYVGCSPRTCYPDADNNQKLNVNDFMGFLNRFAARDPYGDCNLDTAYNTQDFVCFLTRFGAGCP